MSPKGYSLSPIFTQPTDIISSLSPPIFTVRYTIVTDRTLYSTHFHSACWYNIFTEPSCVQPRIKIYSCHHLYFKGCSFHSLAMLCPTIFTQPTYVPIVHIFHPPRFIWWQDLHPNRVTPIGCQICNRCKWRHLVAKFVTDASGQIFFYWMWCHPVAKVVSNSSGLICN